MTLINKLIAAINRKICRHRTEDLVRKVKGNRYYAECVRCGFETPGFLTGKGA